MSYRSTLAIHAAAHADREAAATETSADQDHALTLPTADRYEATRVLAPRLTHVANRLREQANRFDRLAELISVAAPGDEEVAYADAVANAVQQLMNEVANLSLGGIISSAAKVDVYRAAEGVRS